jgi:hypothetical protein
MTGSIRVKSLLCFLFIVHLLAVNRCENTSNSNARYTIAEWATETFLFDNFKGEPTGLPGKKHTDSAGDQTRRTKNN